jgi:putative ATP-binding cassette transporter
MNLIGFLLRASWITVAIAALTGSFSGACSAILILRLSGWILSCPLRYLEELGANRILATLTEDIQSISIAVVNIPFLSINIALVIGCLAYLGWLSWAVFLVTVVLIAAAITSVQFLLTKVNAVLKLARDEQDRLFKHFRALTDGIKELKLHARRS